jgi:hypothetical protein
VITRTDRFRSGAKQGSESPCGDGSWRHRAPSKSRNYVRGRAENVPVRLSWLPWDRARTGPDPPAP